MAISLKEQLRQAQNLSEVNYHAPVFDKKYYDKSHNSNHSEGRKSGRKLFYDFYAMEFLWSFLGSGQIPKAEREKLIDMDPDDPRRDIISSRGHRFLPSSAVHNIDKMYEQVTAATAKNLLAYVRLAVIQEFQYLVTHSGGWSKFRQQLISAYNKNGKISKEEFNKIVHHSIPEMAPYPDVIKRLLKYSKFYSETNTVDDKDAYDISRNAINGDEKEVGNETPSTSEPEPTASEEPSSQEEPDTTDYDAKPVRRQFGKYGNPGQPEYPDKHPYSGLSSFKDVADLPEIPAGDEEDDDDQKEPLKEEYINSGKIRDVYAAINKAGLTLDDIEKAYNKIPWGGSYGGPKWGAGAIALLKLSDAKKNMSTEDMNHIIDHIYDLQHNTGSLLNKGPMFIDDTDLNRRYKITDVARFIPYVSDAVKNMILRYQKYLRHDPADAEKEANMERLLKSPKVPFDPAEAKQLTDLGFQPEQDNSFKVGIHFKDKQGEPVYGVFYQVSKNEIGDYSPEGVFTKKENVAPSYVVADNLHADVKAFATFQEAFNYVKSYEKDMDKHASFGSGQIPHHVPVIKSEKDMYLENHTRTKLGPSQEQQLLDINIGWRKKGKKYYKAYFASGKRYMFYAFTDGSFLCTFGDTTAFKTFKTFNDAYEYSKEQVKTAQEYPEKADNQHDIDIALGKVAATVPTVTHPTKSKDYYLSDDEFLQLQTFVDDLPQNQIDKHSLIKSDSGLYVIVQQHYHKKKVILSVGAMLDDSSNNTPYKIIKATPFSNSGSVYPFKNWNDLFNYLQTNVKSLISPILPSAVTPPESSAISSLISPSGVPLPANASSKAAYSAHVGINKPPTTTLRLTKEDEATVDSLGFKPQLINNEVWYIHTFTGDAVKFYPNNMAKVMSSKNIGGKPLVVNWNGIDKAIDWLETKYNSVMKQSPLTTGQATPASPQVIGLTNKGVKAGVMFEKQIADAGFIWDGNKNVYQDGDNTLKIRPNRSSLLHIKDGDQQFEFKDLITLVTFLKNDYLKKKSSPGSITAKPFANEQTALDISDVYGKKLATAGFLKQIDVGGNVNYVNPLNNFRFIVFPNKVRWTSVNGIKEQSLSNEQLVGFLNAVFNVLVPSLSLDDCDKTFSQEADTMSDED